jgi:hypothetical protein
MAAAAAGILLGSTPCCQQSSNSLMNNAVRASADQLLLDHPNCNGCKQLREMNGMKMQQKCNNLLGASTAEESGGEEQNSEIGGGNSAGTAVGTGTTRSVDSLLGAISGNGNKYVIWELPIREVLVPYRQTFHSTDPFLQP